MDERSGESLEVWGGIECTLNRVGDIYYDQLAWSGHARRAGEDLERVAELGIRTLRMPVRWDEIAETSDWSFADATINAAKRLGVRPVLGLLHHGSGPRTTNLLDAGFPEALAEFAGRVASRYPWVRDYTPVNEPQTTGRFACLYGFWYPHARDMRCYVRALYNQMKGIALSMEAIRRVQPEARLIHTEDGGMTRCAPGLERYCREREQRRWLGMDLLCGRVTRQHELFGFLLRNGLGEREVMWFAERPCSPAVVGLNYYVTSDRYLDERVWLYPDFMRGGDNGDEPLVDVEAVRASAEGIAGSKAVLMQAWQRYGLPVAITEAHLGCEPSEQIRWLGEMWEAAQEARAAGADVRAVTVWGLLGLHNWANLCTRDEGMYEAGVFDLSSGVPVATALAEVVRQMARGGEIRHPAMRRSGWWRRASRITIPLCDEEKEDCAA